eukprot:9536135-Alexandrium_andersonii.AAC.1
MVACVDGGARARRLACGSARASVGALSQVRSRQQVSEQVRVGENARTSGRACMLSQSPRRCL